MLRKEPVDIAGQAFFKGICQMVALDSDKLVDDSQGTTPKNS